MTNDHHLSENTPDARCEIGKNGPNKFGAHSTPGAGKEALISWTACSS